MMVMLSGTGKHVIIAVVADWIWSFYQGFNLITHDDSKIKESQSILATTVKVMVV